MTRRDVLTCEHEPFGDAFYYGRERLSERFMNDEEIREESGYANCTFKTILEKLAKDSSEVRPFLSTIIRRLEACLPETSRYIDFKHFICHIFCLS
jgi:hypothetical protein